MTKQKCMVCNEKALFYIWSTSRVFNRKKFLELYESNKGNISKLDRNILINGSFIVCQHCCHKHNLISR